MKKLQCANWSPSTVSPIPSIAFHDNGVQTVKVDVETVKSTSLLLRTAGGGEVKASSQIQRNTNTFQTHFQQTFKLQISISMQHLIMGTDCCVATWLCMVLK